jgi:hypothetical protein
MSKVEVDQIDPQSGTTLTLGTSGDTIVVPSGVTFNSSAATNTLPSSVVTTTGTQTLTNKSIVATQLTGTITPSDDTVTLAKMAPGTDGNIISYDASGNPVAVATGSAAQVLTSAGAGAPPTFATATVPDNAITLAKMASGTDGNIISYDASGNPVAVATGSAAQVLTSAGAGAPPTFATATVPDDAITLAKMAPGTDGNIISYDASGNPVAVATGSSGQILTSAGAGAVPSFQSPAAGGSMVLIKTWSASNAGNVTFDNGSNGVVFDNTYKTYFLNAQRVYGATNDQKLLVYTRVNGSNSSQSFRNVITYNTYNGQYNTDPATAPNNDKLYQNAGTIRNTYPDGYFNGQFYLYGIGENTRMAMTGQATYKNNAGYQHNEAFCSGSDGTETTNGIRFQMGSGNIYGTFSLYGLVT